MTHEKSILRHYRFPPDASFFLFGPRGTGKTTWLKECFGESLRIDLLQDSTHHQLLTHPDRLEELILAHGKPQHPIVIDEIQRIPILLNEVHRLIESRKWRFILTGSSCRKLKRENANMLGGRARLRNFHPLTAEELGDQYDIRRSLAYGQMPIAYFAENPEDYLKGYLGTYLREEVQQEALTRGLGTFSKFLEVASFSQGNVLNVQSVGSDVGVDRNTAVAYFQLLEDLLLGVRLEVFTRRAKRKITQRPKFYFFDTGVYRSLRPKGPLDSDSEIDGPALETLVFQELRAIIDMHQIPLQMYFWRTQSKLEVDFVLYGESGLFAFEVKRSARLTKEDFKGLKAFKEDYPMAQAFLLYGGEEERDVDGIKVRAVAKTLPAMKKILSG